MRFWQITESCFLSSKHSYFMPHVDLFLCLFLSLIKKIQTVHNVALRHSALFVTYCDILWQTKHSNLCIHLSTRPSSLRYTQSCGSKLCSTSSPAFVSCLTLSLSPFQSLSEVSSLVVWPVWYICAVTVIIVSLPWLISTMYYCLPSKDYLSFSKSIFHKVHWSSG